ncbi:MAG: MarR family transcriptional regulator [Ruminococcaceae bacterium]|nr:MarR family transcriptional regulator [Oscillospiraceae bacterium]
MTIQQDGAEELSLLALPQLQRLVMSGGFFRTFGFTKSQWIIFAALLHRGSLTMSQAAAYISSSKEQATRAVAQMVAEGYVAREIDPDNRTHVRISLTEAGLTLAARCRREVLPQLHDRLSASLTEQDQQELCRSLASIIRILDRVV